MTSYEVVFFINHKYGEQAYIVETDKDVLVFTTASKWRIIKDDYRRFGIYTLFHSNNSLGYGMHVQMRGKTIPFLVYQAIMHDNPQLFSDRSTWDSFKKSWCLYLIGRECEERAALFDWMGGID